MWLRQWPKLHSSIYNIELLLVCASKEPHVRPCDVINQTFQLFLSDPSTDNWKQEEFFSSIAQFMTSCYADWNEHWYSSERKLTLCEGTFINTKNLTRTKAKCRAIDLTVLFLIQCLLFWCCFFLKLWICSWPDRKYRGQIFWSTAEFGEKQNCVAVSDLLVKPMLFSLPTRQSRQTEIF